MPDDTLIPISELAVLHATPYGTVWHWITTGCEVGGEMVRLQAVREGQWKSCEAWWQEFVAARSVPRPRTNGQIDAKQAAAAEATRAGLAEFGL